MASLKKRGNKYIVIYRGFKDGEYKQLWESYDNYNLALKRKKEVEALKSNNIKKLNGAMTVSDLINKYVEVYGIHHWSPDTYTDKLARIKNYINPYISNLYLSDCNAERMDQYFAKLEDLPTKVGNGHKKSGKKVSPRTVKECYLILKGAFDLAVKYDLLSKNPCEHASLPTCKKAEERCIWNMETFKKVIASEEVDDLMYNIMNLGVTATARIGEIMGLQWRNTHIDDELINENRAYIEIVTELNRFNKESIAITKTKKIIFIFPNLKEDSKTVTVLTEPKTQKSRRKVFIPKTVAVSLKNLKQKQEKIKAYKGEEFQDYDLVFCQENGRPIERKLSNKRLKKLCKKVGLPIITTHSLRHGGATLKLELSNGNIKAVQSDTGHTQSKTLMDIYAHTFNEDRIKTTRKLEKELYNAVDNEDEKIIKMIKNDPRLKDRLRTILEKV